MSNPKIVMRCAATSEGPASPFYVLFGGALLSIFALHFPINAWTLSQFVLFSIVVAELVKFASQIVFFRRGI